MELITTKVKNKILQNINYVSLHDMLSTKIEFTWK
jgi:hypothetical protein